MIETTSLHESLLESFSGPGWSRLVLTLVHSLWQGVAVALLLVLALRFSAGRRSRLRYALCCFALLAAPAGSLLTWSWLSHGDHREAALTSDSAESPDHSAGFATMPDANVQPVASSGLASAATWSDQPLRSTIDGVPVEPNRSESDTLSPGKLSGSLVSPLAAVIWILGVLAMLVRMTRQIIAGRRLCHTMLPADSEMTSLVEQLSQRLGIRRRIRVLMTEQLQTPAVMGAVWPVLLLPGSMVTGLSAEQLRVVLIHELAHIRRHDYLVNLGQMLIESLLFFNPAVWWISRQLRVEREACADAVAVSSTDNPLEYASVLATCAERISLQSVPPLAQAFAEQRGSRSVLERVRRVLSPDSAPGLRIRWTSLVGVLVLSGAVLFAAEKGAQVVVEAAARLLTPEERMEVLVEARNNVPKTDETDDAPEKREIKGRVETQDGKPLPLNTNLTEFVSRRNSSSSISHTLFDNEFAHRIPNGETYLWVKAEGYAATILGPVPASKDAAAVDDLKIVLKRGTPADIRLEDEAGTPIPDASVECRFRVAWGTAYYGMLTSDADGIVRLEHPTESVTYELKIRRSGFEMLTATGIKLDRNKPPVIQLVKARPTTGVIVNADGRPVANAKVMLYGTDSPRQPHPQRQSPPEELAVTDETGYFTLDTLEADNRYSLDIQTENDGRHLIHGVRSGEVDRPIRLDPELVLEGTIAGDLDRLILKNSDIPYGSKEERDKLIGTHGFTCRLNETYGGMGHSVDVWVVSVTVDNGVGHFRIGNLIPATVALYGAGRRAKVRVTEPVRDFVFNIDDGPTRDRKLVLQFNPPDGNVPPEGEVSVHIRGPRETTDQVIETLPIKNGRIEVDCYAPGRVYFIPQNIVGYWFNSAWVEIDGDTKPLHHDVPLVPAGAISGVIRHSDGRPASTKTNIRYGTIEHAPEMLHKSSLGDEVHPAADGKYFLSPVPLGGTYYVYAIEDRLLTVVGPVQVDASKPSASVDIVLPRGITIRGKVLDPEGRPLPGMKVGPGVSFFSLALGMNDVETNDAGEFTAGPINPDAGKNSITVRSRIDFQTAYLKVIDLSKPIIIRMERGLKASGVVLDEETGWPIPNAEVFAHPETYGISCDAEGRTDNNGRFRFSNLPKTKMKFRLRGASYDSPGSFIVSDPGDMDLTFRVKGNSKLKPRKPDYLP